MPPRNDDTGSMPSPSAIGHHALIRHPEVLRHLAGLPEHIDRMSDYCKGCAYDPAIKAGPKACPFNYLYWNFLIENQGKLARNPRMAMPYRTLEKFSEAKRAEIVGDATRFFATLSEEAIPAKAQLALEL